MSYRIAFLPRARKDFDEWKRNDGKMVERIKELLRDIAEHPYSGIGKPEPLKHNLKGLWSRRINEEHRLVYQVADGMIYVYVLSMRFHYK